MSNERTRLGDRMKAYERRETAAFLPHLPIVVRVDGHNFSKYTADMSKPYDTRLASVMLAVTRHLVEETCAVVGYTQSDEISLVLYGPYGGPDVHFGGKPHKIVSRCASMATAAFHSFAHAMMPTARYMAQFDCRAHLVPSLDEAANYLLWRELDATNNSVCCVAQAFYSQSELAGKSRAELCDLIHAKGYNWNDYPVHFRRGFYYRRPSDGGAVARLSLDPLTGYTHEERVQLLFGQVAEQLT